jgi:hypothetical protein
MKIEQDLANALLRSEVISPALLDFPTHSYGARAGLRKVFPREKTSWRGAWLAREV